MRGLGEVGIGFLFFDWRCQREDGKRRDGVRGESGVRELEKGNETRQRKGFVETRLRGRELEHERSGREDEWMGLRKKKLLDRLSFGKRNETN